MKIQNFKGSDFIFQICSIANFRWDFIFDVERYFLNQEEFELNNQTKIF